MRFGWLILVVLAFFGAYSIAPVFGLDELYPDLLGEAGAFGRVALLAIMIAGGVLYLIERRRRRRDD